MFLSKDLPPKLQEIIDDLQHAGFDRVEHLVDGTEWTEFMAGTLGLAVDELGEIAQQIAERTQRGLNAIVMLAMAAGYDRARTNDLIINELRDTVAGALVFGALLQQRNRAPGSPGPPVD